MIRHITFVLESLYLAHKHDNGVSGAIYKTLCGFASIYDINESYQTLVYSLMMIIGT